MDLFQHHPNVSSQYVRPRQVDVWLPAAYAVNANGRFPVLYMHDGQNLFDPADSYAGETWGIRAAMNRLIAAGEIPPTIVVGIWNGEELRWPEYLPQRPFAGPHGQRQLLRVVQEFTDRLPDPTDLELLSDNYLRFLITELKPFIDANYRTRPEREHTLVMGSSMGGLISLYALCEYPEIFAGAGCVSTHWPATAGVMLDYLGQHLPPPGRHRLYFDYGTATLDAAYEPFQLEVDALLAETGYTLGEDWITRKFPGAEHAERAWRERVHIPLRFLLRDSA